MQIRTFLLLGASAACLSLQAETQNEGIQDSTQMSEVVVTGTRNATDIRHLPMTVNTISRERLTANERSSVLPTIMEEVPGVLVTSRGMLGYGVSTGGSGSINVRGLSSGAGQMLVLIDGHPQYQGIFGHGIADSYQTNPIGERRQHLLQIFPDVGHCFSYSGLLSCLSIFLCSNTSIKAVSTTDAIT